MEWIATTASRKNIQQDLAHSASLEFCIVSCMLRSALLRVADIIHASQRAKKEALL
jgi:hypothetical protein